MRSVLNRFKPYSVAASLLALLPLTWAVADVSSDTTETGPAALESNQRHYQVARLVTKLS